MHSPISQARMNPGEWEQRQRELDMLLRLIHRLRDRRDALPAAAQHDLDTELEQLLRRHREAREELVAPEFHQAQGRVDEPRNSSSYYDDMQQAVERAMSRFGAPD